MNGTNKIEIIGFTLLVIGTFLWFSADVYFIVPLSEFYPYGQIVFWFGLLIWAIGYMLKEKKAKMDKKNQGTEK